MLSFTFNNKNSYADYGIIIARRPIIPMPKRQVNYTAVPGRDGALKEDLEAYENITFALECAVMDASLLISKIRDVKAWLMNAKESDLLFSFEADKKYRAQVINEIDFEQVIKVFGRFVIVFDAEPFAYTVANTPITLTTSPTTLNNSGSIPSRPIIKLTGTGDVTLTINGFDIKLYNIDGYVTVDSVIMDCYKGAALKNSDMTGDFPALIVGNNTISWIGTVSGVEITPNYRYI